MSNLEQLAAFVARSSYEQLSSDARLRLKIRILDTIGCAIGAIGHGPATQIRAYAQAWSSDGPCAFVGGGRGAPDHAALLNGALVRYTEFNDSYLAPGETCHPSDNFAAVLAAAELGDADGCTLMTALAAAYQVQCRLSDAAPLRRRGFDHTTHLAYSASAGAARALKLDAERTAHAIAMSGAALNALRVTRAGALSQWKTLAGPFAAASALEAALFARSGITGPLGILDDATGFATIAGPVRIQWDAEDLERVCATSLKRFDADIHSQTAIQTAIELREKYRFRPDEIAMIEVDVFDVAYHISGGGGDHDKTIVATREDAAHSLPYLVAVALLDGTVGPAQYRAARIQRSDVQRLLCRVMVRPHRGYSRRFPDEMPSRVWAILRDGRRFSLERNDYPGFRTNPVLWEAIYDKYLALASPHASLSTLRELAGAVRELEIVSARELARLLNRIAAPARPTRVAAA
jgi:2-methylcitrate dehydratase